VPVVGEPFGKVSDIETFWGRMAEQPKPVSSGIVPGKRDFAAGWSIGVNRGERTPPKRNSPTERTLFPSSTADRGDLDAKEGELCRQGRRTSLLRQG